MTNDKPGMTKQAFCSKCSRSVTVYLRRTICSNGAHLVYWLCTEGKKPHRPNRNNPNLSHAALDQMGLSVDDVPLVGELSNPLLCEVLGCMNHGVEAHHWAPKAIFGEEAEQWPQSLLCVQHHQEWHAKIKAFAEAR